MALLAGSGADAVRHLAMSAFEITCGDYRQLDRSFEFRGQSDETKKEQVSDSHPATMISFLAAMRYCRWLSEQEKIAEDQMCYPRIEEIGPGHAVLSEDQRRRSGYRLPTEVEWSFAARAGGSNSKFVGTFAEHVDQCAWTENNADRHTQPVGLLCPNPFGFHDILGNAAEWCHPVPREGQGHDRGALRGGCYDQSAKDLLHFEYDIIEASRGWSFTGFRIVRTINSTASTEIHP